jgi:hypothetical protein
VGSLKGSSGEGLCTPGRAFAFTFAGGTNIKDGDMHMREAKITLVDADHLKAEWTAWSGGKADHTMVFDLARTK